jgi:hypothetical protein
MGSSKKAFFVFVGIPALGIAAMLAQKFGYPRFKEYRGRQLAAEASALLVAGKTNDAIVPLKAANRFAPNDPGVVRLRAQYLFRLNPGAALQDWQILTALGRATFEDKINFLETSVALHRADVSAPLLTELAPAQSTNSRILRLGITHLTETGFTDRAIGLARYALAQDPLDLTNQFNLGSLLIGNTNPPLAGQGLALLTDVARVQGPLQTPAISRLVNSGQMNSGQIPELLAILDLNLGNITNNISALTLRWQARTNERPEIAAKAKSQLAAESSTTNSILLASWLLPRDPAGLLEVLPEDRALLDPVLGAHHGEALARTAKWQDLASFLRKSDHRIPESTHLILRARMAAAEGRFPDAENLLLGAADISSRNTDALIFIARLAEEIGLPDIAIRIWTRISEFQNLMLAAGGQALRLAKDRDQVEAEITVLTRLSNFAPNDFRLAAERAEREALNGSNLDNAESSLKKVIEEEKDADPSKNRRFVSALALVRLRKGDSAAALSTFEQGTPEWSKLSTREQVTYVAILGANQQREAARRYARQIDIGSLKRQEKELLQPWL